MPTTYDALKLPSHVKTILITGAGGFVGQELTQLLLKLFPNIRLVTTDIVQPPEFDKDSKRLRAVKADLGDQKQLDGIFEGEEIGGIYALHGIMSGGSEANFDLGWAVNVDSNVKLLKKVHAHGTEKGIKPTFVFVSSLAVYGGPKCTPSSFVVPDETPILAQTSYGVQKQIIELYAYDYGRKGYIDTRSVRLPSVAIRAGAPSTAASSWVSGLIREPLQGLETVFPLADSPDDPILDTMGHYIGRTNGVVRNIAYALCMPESNFKPGQSRSIIIPGVKITPRIILKSLAKYGGEDKLKLVKYKKDPAVIAICNTWAGDYDTVQFQKWGFEVDDLETGYDEAVEEFQALLKAEGKLA